MDAPAVLAAVERALDEHFMQPPARASVSFLGVEPIEVLRYEPIPGETAYLSLGMSRRPMTAAEREVADPNGPRAELMLHLRSDRPGTDEAWRSLAVLAAAPVVEGVVYAPGMTVDMGQSLAPGSTCTGAVVVASPLAPVTLTGRAGGTDSTVGDVAVLQLLPATPAELAWARVHGSDALRALWQEQECDLLDLGRQGAALPQVGA
jgi:hypothetical protein